MGNAPLFYPLSCLLPFHFRGCLQPFRLFRFFAISSWNVELEFASERKAEIIPVRIRAGEANTPDRH
jgi:hypothetical protein